MSEIVGSDTTVSEAYAFACLSCGHGWEQSYDIEHHVDVKGQAFVTYVAAGEKVPSPLTRPTCLNCGGHKVRIMRSGQVTDAMSLWSTTDGERAVHRTRHWSLLHRLHRKHGDVDTA
jgi:hypothetical protein